MTQIRNLAVVKPLNLFQYFFQCVAAAEYIAYKLYRLPYRYDQHRSDWSKITISHVSWKF